MTDTIDHGNGLQGLFTVVYNSPVLTTLQAAEKLKLTRQRVHALIASGKLPATKQGRDWFIQPADLAKVRDRKPGRPKKNGKA
jgi:excisionase family DNA binding protein